MKRKKKIFDSVEMVREIRNAMYRKKNDPDFDDKEFERIKAKWTKLLEDQEKDQPSSIAAEPSTPYRKRNK